MEKLGIPLGSAQPGVGTPTEQRVGDLSHSPGAKLCVERGHIKDECSSPYYRERGFAVQEELIEQQVGEQDVGGDELKYDEGVGESEYTEELADDFVAMITVEYEDGGDCLDVSEVVALSFEVEGRVVWGCSGFDN